MISYEQAAADLHYWTVCAEIAEKYGESRWVATGWSMGGVSYGEAIRGAMLVMHSHEEHTWMRDMHIGGAIDQVLCDVRRRMLLYQARKQRGVA